VSFWGSPRIPLRGALEDDLLRRAWLLVVTLSTGHLRVFRGLREVTLSCGTPTLPRSVWLNVFFF
jgi:hypothetical protein